MDNNKLPDITVRMRISARSFCELSEIIRDQGKRKNN